MNITVILIEDKIIKLYTRCLTEIKVIFTK